jgi:O-antigen ligase
MMGVGLLFSYSRGAWVGTTGGLLYLAKAYGKFKWRFVLAGILVVAVVGWFFWNTPRTAPWYFQRLDFSRGSVQHRVATWRGAFQMMRDYPFGAGWNRAVDIYQKNYSRPENGAGAIITNDYLMLGTQLGLPALLCFVAYVGLALKGERRKEKAETLQQIGNRKSEIGNKMACRAGALAMLVAFWFNGGLFKLATAAVFWILLELGSVSNAEGRMKKAEADQSLVPPSPRYGATSTSAATK